MAVFDSERVRRRMLAAAKRELRRSEWEMTAEQQAGALVWLRCVLEDIRGSVTSHYKGRYTGDIGIRIDLLSSARVDTDVAPVISFWDALEPALEWDSEDRAAVAKTLRKMADMVIKGRYFTAKGSHPNAAESIDAGA